MYDITDEVPEDYKSLCELFPSFMAHASKERPLCIVIDSLDQLTDEDGARRFLEWLPRKLPAHACIIVSTLPEEGGCMQRLKTFGIPAEQFLQVNNSIECLTYPHEQFPFSTKAVCIIILISGDAARHA